MKVIEGPKEWTSKVNCAGCTATLEVGMDDVTVGEFGGNYLEDGNKYVYVNCCVCGTCVKLKEYHQMPLLVQQRATANYNERKGGNAGRS